MNVRRNYNMKKLIIILTLLFTSAFSAEYSELIHPKDCILYHASDNNLQFDCNSYDKEVESMYFIYYFKENDCFGTEFYSSDEIRITFSPYEVKIHNRVNDHIVSSRSKLFNVKVNCSKVYNVIVRNLKI